MSTVRMEVHAVSVSGFAMYTCRVCGVVGRGSFTKVVVAGCIPTQDEVDRAVNTSNMPAGWACYSRNEYACSEHVV